MIDLKAATLATLRVIGVAVAIGGGGAAVLLAIIWIAEHTPPLVREIEEWAGRAVIALFLLIGVISWWMDYYHRYASLANSSDKRVED